MLSGESGFAVFGMKYADHSERQRKKGMKDMADKEYIERGALLKMSPFTVYGAVVSEYAEGYLDCADEARKAVNDAPAADVVEVVRCKDCDYCKDTSDNTTTEPHWGECRKPLGDYRYCETAECDFCSYGERKE